MKRTDCWEGCYSNGWCHDDLVPEAFAHPAKKAKGLGIRIVEHAIERGWIAPGQLCVDPFGGVATIALTLNLNGINYAGCELEPRFVALAQSNMDKWRAKYGAMPGFGLARIVQGDSRRLVEVMREAEGQLSTMREGDAPACVISSPPYSSGEKGHPSIGSVNNDNWGHDGHGIARRRGKTGEYGESAGQLGAMPAGDVAAVISSPPYEGIEIAQTKQGDREARVQARREGTWEGYNKENAENLGSNTGDTFWEAARDIVAQCHQILRPGGMAIWVCKDFVRKGKRVPFSDQWLALCESQGFVLECRHRAMLVENGGTQGGLFGEDKELKVSRKSFFRRLAESKGSPEINWEDVICVRKPLL